MATAGSIVIDLLMRTGAFETDSKRAERRMRALQKEIDDIARKAATASAAAAAAIIGIGTVMVRSGTQSATALSRMSGQIGVTTEDLGALRHAAAQLAGVADNTLDMSLRRMTRRIAEAAEGSGPAAAALESIGLEAEELARHSPDEQFRRIAGAMQGIGDQGTRLRATMAIFDTEGMPLVTALGQGREAIEAMEAEAHALGLTLSGIDAARIELASRATDTVQRTMGAFSQQLAAQFAPAIEDLAKRVFGLAGEFGGVQGAAESAFDAVLKGAAFVADAVEGVRRVFTIAADGMVIASAALGQTLARIAGGVANIASLIPGLDFSEGAAAFEAFAQTSEGVIEQAWANITDTLEKPLPGDAIKQWAAEVKQSSDEAAAALLAARTAGDGAVTVAAADDGSLEKARSQIDGLIASLTQQIATYEQSAEATIRYRITQGDLAESFAKLGADAAPLADQLIALTVQYDELQAETRRAADAQRELDELVAQAGRVYEATRTPLEQFNAEVERLNKLRDTFVDGGPLIDEETYRRAIEQAQDALTEATKETNQFLEQASRNTQDIIARNLRDGFEGGARGIRDSFVNLINDLVAQALAAQLAEKLFGGEGVGSGGGLIGRAAGFLGGFFGGGRASGGPVSPGVTYRVNELEPEFFRPSTSGEVVPLSRMPAGAFGGGVNVSQTINVQGRPDQRTASQIAIETARRQRIASARLG